MAVHFIKWFMNGKQKMNEKNKELLFSITKKDFIITYFNGKGAGGQHRNKHKNCVRIQHKDSGIISIGQDQRKLNQNLKAAFTRLVKNPKFKLWIKMQASSMLLNTTEIQQKVEEQMQDKYLKVEYLGDK